MIVEIIVLSAISAINTTANDANNTYNSAFNFLHPCKPFASSKSHSILKDTPRTTNINLIDLTCTAQQYAKT